MHNYRYIYNIIVLPTLDNFTEVGVQSGCQLISATLFCFGIAAVLLTQSCEAYTEQTFNVKSRNQADFHVA